MAPALIVDDTHHNHAPVKKSSMSAVLKDAETRFTARNPTSLKLHEEAVQSLPGGNTRSLLHTAPFPVYMKSGKDYQVTSEDGHTYAVLPPPSVFYADGPYSYTDFVGELTAGLFGHSNPIILETLHTTLNEVGLNLGATTRAESQYASLLCSRFAIDRIRFCNSGTEANLHALNAARKHTGRRKVIVAHGGYHGAVLSFPHGAAENNVDAADWLLATYNDAESVRSLITEHGADVAAVLVEAMQGAGGAIPGSREFLHACQNAAHAAGALFILDEVMTSRLAPGGLASSLGLQPDLKTFGKYLGGGLAFGAFGGRSEVMSVYDPRKGGSLAHSGTFNNNTLAMAAGYAGLSKIYTPEVCTAFTAVGDDFRRRLNEACAGTRVCFTGVGTIMVIHIAKQGVVEEKAVVNKDSVDEDWDVKDLFWYEMMEEWFWITRRGSFALILGTPASELTRFVEVVKAWLKKHESLLED